ncbi:peptidase S10, serine carboxypeptidase [Auriculariales sp. MPI-PUGE-AT-0066]|nr:peptidase S10, serine carboxypeptidase [Auriculariales sp. MPI-PUGE-AT-0066]
MIGLIVLFIVASAALGVHVPSERDVAFDGFPAPKQELSSLALDKFTTLKHNAYPDHSMRIKRTRDMPTNRSSSYAGYIDIEARHLFFYFYESRSTPDVDPVLMWINGGPGCSSAIGAFMELGLSFDHATSMTAMVESTTLLLELEGMIYLAHELSLTSHHFYQANLFILDQPIGTGFSYADHGERVSTTEEAATDVVAFIAIFFERFKKFEGRAFHMSGESYGPVYASVLYDANALAVAQGLTLANLQSTLIGNGLTDFLTLTPSYYDLMCTNASVKPFLLVSSCVRIQQIVRSRGVFLHFGDFDAFLVHWRKNFGVSPHPGNFTSCSERVQLDFGAKQDELHTSNLWVAELLERDIRVNGTVDDEYAGITKSEGPFTSATVDKAGHMVSYNRPVQALAMLNWWLAGKPL